METLPYVQVREPFGKITFCQQPDGSKQVRAYVLGERIVEGAQTGVAIQASNSMKGAFGYVGWQRLLGRRTGLNAVELMAQRMCSYLARKIDADKRTLASYWATGDGGAQVEEIGHLAAYEAERHLFAGPRKFGPAARLLPAVQYYVDRFEDASWGMYVFITDGNIQDLEAVKQYSAWLAGEISAGRRHKLKLVMIGIGQRIDRSTMRQLDDLDTGTGVDLWDHRLAAEMRSLMDIFAEVVDENTVIAESGLVRDPFGNIVKDYRGSGVPSLMTFTLPAGSESFTLETPQGAVIQPLLG